MSELPISSTGKSILYFCLVFSVFAQLGAIAVGSFRFEKIKKERKERLTAFLNGFLINVITF